MKPQLFNFNGKNAVLPLVFAVALAGCDSESLLLTDPAADTAGAIAFDDPVSSTADASDSAGVDDAAVATTEGEAESVGEDSIVLSDPSTDTDSLGGDVAASLLAARTALGPVKIMAVGDSITHGVAGVSSYRREFTALLESASCSFTMVGSQQTSQPAGRDPDCIDTGIIGDGWGWNGTESCLVGQETAVVEPYVGAHEGYSSHRADHFLTGNVTSAGDNPGIQVSMQIFDPDVVLLHVGSVDMFNQQTVASTVTDINNVLNTINETKPNTLVLIANIIPWFSDKPYPEIGRDVESVGDGVEALVAARQDPLLKIVDVRSGFTEGLMLDDLIHPNEIGEAHIADAFASVYQPLAACSSR